MASKVSTKLRNEKEETKGERDWGKKGEEKKERKEREEWGKSERRY